jgi:AAA+ ATPase superfamily predicted ATPase
VERGVLRVEFSREQPLKTHPKHKLKKELRHYRIQDKLRFVDPFLRFWFGFVSFYRNELIAGKGDAFLANFQNHYERLRTLVFEQLCDALLVDYFADTSPLLSHGSYWNQHSEFDILALNSDKKLILGECKYKDRKVCKNELNKLQAKAAQSGIRADIYALFSKDGLSNELKGMASEELLLFDLNDLQRLC